MSILAGMRQVFNQLVLWMVLSGMLGCDLGVKPDSAVVKASAINSPGLEQSESPSITKSAESAEVSHVNSCSQVDEKAVRGACFKPVSGGRMCQPQSIPYARCRSQIATCNLGNTSPVQLFNCEQRRGYTSSIPQAGSLMSIGVNRVHHMSTGHTLYVEEVCPLPNGHFKLRVSHTNYDRKCHLEEDAWVEYDSKRKAADFATGHWAAWGKDLPVQGFILHDLAGGKSRN